MKRTTVFLDQATLKRIKQLAAREGKSFALVVREALAAYTTTPRAGVRLPSIAGRFTSGQADTSERVDELLWRDPHT